MSVELACARRTIEAYAPTDAAQLEQRARMLAFVDAHPRDAHLRELREGHLTASALVFDRTFERVLLTHHRKLGRWLQLGGHCDGDADLARVALKECREESGIPSLRPLSTDVLDLDVHPIPSRPGEPRHLHYDARFAVWNAEDEPQVVGDESNALGWFTPREIDELDTDESVRRLVRIGFARISELRCESEAPGRA